MGIFNLTQFSVAATVPGVAAVTEKSDSAGGSFTRRRGRWTVQCFDKFGLAA